VFRYYLLALALALPFLGRAYFVDDHYHLQMAEGLLRHPARPYDFLADDDGVANAGWERGKPPRMVNPPLHHYLMSVLLKVSGDPFLGPSPENPAAGRRIWVVRLGMAAFSALSVLFIGLLARRFLVPPGPAMALAALTPAFWLSSYALLIDSTMLVFFLGGLVSWVEGVKGRRPGLLVLSGVLMGATILTKYTGAFVVFLALLYWLLEGDAEGRRNPRQLAALLLPVVAVALWSWWNTVTYGAPHLSESSKRVMQSFAWSHVLTFLTFLGGVFIFPLGAWGWASRRSPRFFLAAGTVASISGAVLATPWGGFSLFQGYLMSFLVFGGTLFLAEISLIISRGGRKTDFFLLAWLLLGTAQMICVMQWVAARYYLTILPPAVLLFLRALQEDTRHFPRAFSRRSALWGGALFLAAAAMSRADFSQAGTSRLIALDTARDGWVASGRACYYLGDSFSSSHLRYAGWRPAFQDTPLKPGDLVLHQEVVMPRWWFRVGANHFRLVKTYDYPSRFPVRVMDNRGAAGFYASAWGALPFTFSRGPLERFLLLEVQ
jgi:hypothetical protein